MCGGHFCRPTPVLMNMSNITFEIPRLSTFVFKKCSEKIHSRLNIVIRAQMVLVGIMLAQRRRRWPSITSALGQCILLAVLFWRQDGKRHPQTINAAVRKHGTITQCCFKVWPA